MELKTLYKKASGGNLQQWRIWVEGSTIFTEYGQVGGKLQVTEDTIKEGKNLGKKNETTPEEQARLEAASKWKIQQEKKGYVEDISRAEAEDDDRQGEVCMLAQPYGTLENGVFVPDQNKKIKFPCAIQPKLDGHRCRVRADKTLWSRGQKPILSVPHVVEELQRMFPNAAPKLDGELYNHDLKEDFEKLTSILRQQKQVHPEHKLAQYHVYDIDELDMTFEERHEFLQHILANCEFLKPVETRIVNSHEEVLTAYEEFTRLGYEGLILRNLDSLYEGKRSYGLQKLKGFRDMEFKIIGIKEGKGKLQGHAATFTCVTEDGKEFEAKMEGALSNLKDYWENHSLWQGKFLTVRFFAWTKKGVPRNGTGLRFREDI